MSSADSAWSRAFDDPIPLPDGRVLRTLHDAGHYAATLPKAVQKLVERQIAAEMLILAAQVKGRSCSPRLPCGRRSTLKRRGQAAWRRGGSGTE